MGERFACWCGCNKLGGREGGAEQHWCVLATHAVPPAPSLLKQVVRKQMRKHLQRRRVICLSIALGSKVGLHIVASCHRGRRQHRVAICATQSGS